MVKRTGLMVYLFTILVKRCKRRTLLKLLLTDLHIIYQIV